MSDARAEREQAERTAFIQGLRECADFLEQHPTIKVPCISTFNSFVDTREEIAAHARSAAWEKVYTDMWFSLVKRFGEVITLEINTPRETVCRRVVKGTHIEPARPERVVEDVEWIYDEPLLANVGE